MLSYTRNVTPLEGRVLSTLGTMPLYKPRTPSRRTTHRKDWKYPVYLGAHPDPDADVAADVSAAAPAVVLCCMRLRTTCEG